MSGWGFSWRNPARELARGELAAAARSLSRRLEIAIDLDDEIRSPRHGDVPWRHTVVFALRLADVARLVTALTDDPEFAADDLATAKRDEWRLAVEVYPDVGGGATVIAFEAPLLDNEELGDTGFALTDAFAAELDAQLNGVY